jgi:hypothetical protein
MGRLPLIAKFGNSAKMKKKTLLSRWMIKSELDADFESTENFQK